MSATSTMRRHARSRFELGVGTPESKGRVATRIDPQTLRGDEHVAHERFQLALHRTLEELGDQARGQALIERLEAVLAQAR